jgi:NADPH2:quinone reductase
MRAVRVHEYGPPEVLTLEEVSDPEPSPGDLVIAVEAIGTVFSETQVRAGALAKFGLRGPDMPYTPGRDVAGTVIAVGDGVGTERIGTRVAASTTGSGGYAERVLVPASGESVARGAVFSCLAVVPDALGFEEAVALMGQGRTALALARVGRIADGETVLVTAAAGAVGSLLVQLARRDGAKLVVGVARGHRKLEVLHDLGVDVAVDYGHDDWVERVREQVGAGGVDVVFDGVGGDVARGAYSLAADGVGRIIIFGLASGTLAELSAGELLSRGLTLTGFSGAWFARRPEWVGALQSEILELAAEGAVRPVVGQRFPLAEAAAAHRSMEERRTVGKTLLLPDQA